MQGQITLEQYQKQRDAGIQHCGKCICDHCLYWWSSRCPYGGCFDDYRVVTEPYDKIHPDRPPRKTWSDWNKPGEQAHWCRGGNFYPSHYCKHFVRYKGKQVKECIKANVSVFQDGYISCCMVENFGCENCYKELEEKQERIEREIR